MITRCKGKGLLGGNNQAKFTDYFLLGSLLGFLKSACENIIGGASIAGASEAFLGIHLYSDECALGITYTGSIRTDFSGVVTIRYGYSHGFYGVLRCFVFQGS